MGRLLIVAALALLQTASGGNASIAGVVTDSTSSTPVAGATVTLSVANPPPAMGGYTPPRQAFTDASGRFTFGQLNDGVYNINVSKPTYVPAAANALVSSVSISGGGSRSDINLSLQLGGVIAGRVVDDTGQPIVEARVAALRATINGNQPMLTQAGQGTQTNDLGEFRLYGLAAGDYYIQAGLRNEAPFSAGDPAQRTATIATFFPSSVEASGARAVSVASGQTSPNAVITLQRSPVFSVSGVVVDETGAPAPGARVALIRAGASAMLAMTAPRGTQAATDGSFVIGGIPPGPYSVSAVTTPAFPSGPPGAGGVGSISGGFSTSSVGVGGGITTETRNGVTMQYRTQEPTRVNVSVTNDSVTGIRLVAPRPQIIPPATAPR